ncbi:hypothetical protein HYX19_02305 [Candidatus Woesearchaeota archaeon]|nr:hypothetical protein [Candidatus Woesearchaeota archaeon]
MNDLDAIKRKHLEELQRKMLEKNIQEQQKAIEEEAQLQQQIASLENLAKQYMSGEAITRYSNLKVAHFEKAIQVTVIIAEAIKTGNIREKITDQQLKDLLINLQEQKKEFKIQKK